MTPKRDSGDEARSELSKVERWLAGECASRLAQALEAMTVQPCQGSWEPAAEEAEPDTVWWRQPLNLGEGAEIWIGASATVWMFIGRKSLEAAGIEESSPADLKGTYHEILSQGLSAAAQAAGARLGREVTCQPGQEEARGPSSGAPVAVILKTEEQSVRLLAGFGAGLVSALTPQPAASEPKAVETAAPIATGPVDGSKTLELLLEVELPISVSFGRTQLPLKDVLKLTTGSIVELNRSVSEPVEVIVNNCVVARGEVVVVEGNYGVRIQQIISRSERLRSLY